MTRDEQIKQAGKEHSYEIVSVRPNLTKDSFIAGAKWADENPKDGMVSLDKVCEWLENECENKGEYIGGIFGGPCSIRIMFENISKDLRKAMDE